MDVQPCPRVYITAAVVINTTVRGGIRSKISHTTAMHAANRPLRSAVKQRRKWYRTPQT